jgi:glycosyltransferase involved in cell wall biosynthesis
VGERIRYLIDHPNGGPVSTLAKDTTRLETCASPRAGLHVALLTGGRDKPYVFGLVSALAAKGICLDVIGSDEIDSPELHTTHKLRFLNLRGSQRQDAKFARKVWRLLVYYARLIRYAMNAKPRVFHILWNNKFEYFDRTLLLLYYKLLGKRIVLTAHNINAGKRDSNDSCFNRLTLTAQYRFVDHIFVHTEKMKSELVEDFGVWAQKVTVIPFGINNAVPDTDITSAQAKHKLGIRDSERTILFFGNIGPYKGVHFLIAAFQQIVIRNAVYRLIIAGKPRAGGDKYLRDIQQAISRDGYGARVIQKIGYVPDEETEWYFKAADVLVLPYTEVSQSGVLFLGYSFGLPVIAADVGSLEEEIVEGKTGFLCKPCDPVDLAQTIEAYFESDLFKGLSARRQEIRTYATTRHSWDLVAEMTREVYEKVNQS